MEITEILLTFWPIIALQVLLAIWGVVDLVRRKKVKYFDKVYWAAIIVLISFFGPIIYLTVGRGEE